MKKRLQKSLYSHEWETLCAILKRVRKEKGFTQEKLGKLLGRQQNLIAKIEAGERKLDVCQLLDYLEVLGFLRVAPPAPFSSIHSHPGNRRLNSFAFLPLKYSLPKTPAPRRVFA